jgi:vacuolar-type H+-ATPase subunit I/STV1
VLLLEGKMFLSASVDSGIGMTAGKMLCGKAIAQSDDTYLTTVNLRQKFILLKKFLAINEQPKIETQKLEILESAVCKLQEELTQQKQITKSISKENARTKEELRKLQPLVEFINSFDAPENLKTILNFLKDDLLDEYADERLRPLKVEFSPYISKQLAEIARVKGITEREALRELVEDDLKTMENAEEKFKKMEERIKGKPQGTGT